MFTGLFCLSAGALTASDLPAPARQDSFPIPSADSVLLGRDLFFDPILSGNRNISCGTCHHPALASGDEMSLSIGEGGIGLGRERIPDPANLPRARVPRNAPALFKTFQPPSTYNLKPKISSNVLTSSLCLSPVPLAMSPMLFQSSSRPIKTSTQETTYLTPISVQQWPTSSPIFSKRSSRW